MAEEAKHIVHGVSSDVKKTQRVKILRIWQFLTAISVILLVVSIATSGFRTSNSNALSEGQISDKIEKFVNENLLQGQATATVKNVKEINGIYLLSLDVNGQAFETYATKDGSLFFPQAIKTSVAVNEAGQEDSSGKSPDLVEVGNAPIKGVGDAPVTIIEFSDLSCPYCAAAAGKNQDAIDYLKSKDASWEAPLPRIFEDYVETGKVRFAFKYFPGHGTGENAMKLALCADEQGRFWEVHDVFFENQNLVEDAGALKELAAGIGVDREELEACYESGKYDSRLVSDGNEGRAAGVSGTPTFFINGKVVSGAQSFSVFKQMIEAELSG